MPVSHRLSGKIETRRSTAIIGAAMMAALAWGCGVGSPKVPRVTIPFFISVANDTTTIREVASDRSDFLQIGSEDDSEALALNFFVDFGDRGREEVGNRLAVDPVEPDPFFTELGDIEVAAQEDLVSEPVRLGDALPQEAFDAAAAVQALGQEFNLPSQEIDAIPPIALDLPNITSIKVLEGGIQIQITNGFPVGLASMQIILRDLGNNQLVDDILFTDIGVGETSEPANLEFNPDNIADGNVVSGRMELTVTATTAAGDNIELDPEAALIVNVDLLRMILTEMTGLIPQQDFTDSQVLTFPDARILVNEATISKGSLTLIVTNEIPVIMSVTLTLPDLTEGEIPATFRIDELSRDEPTTVTFPLANHVYDPEDPRFIRIQYSAETFPSDTEVTIRSQGRIGVTARPERLEFSNVTGILDNLTLPIDQVSQTVNFPSGLDNVSLDQTFLSVVIRSAVGINSFVDLIIEGVNSFGEPSPELRITEEFEAASPGSIQRIELSIPSDDLTPFLNSLPTQVTVTPTVRIGDGVNEDFIEPDHWVSVDSVNFLAPARFIIESDTQIQPDPEFREFTDADAREKISNNLQQGRVFTQINNHLPLAVSVSLRAARRLEDVYNDDLIDKGGAVDLDSVLVIPRNDDPFGVKAAPVDENGQVIDAQVEAFFDTVRVTKDEALFFLEEGGVYTGVLVQLEGTGGPVELRGDDFITVVAGTAIEIEINESLVK